MSNTVYIFNSPLEYRHLDIYKQPYPIKIFLCNHILKILKLSSRMWNLQFNYLQLVVVDGDGSR